MTTVAKISAAAQMVRIIQRLNGYSSRLYAFDRNRFQQRHASEWTSVSLVTYRMPIRRIPFVKGVHRSLQKEKGCWPRHLLGCTLMSKRTRHQGTRANDESTEWTSGRACERLTKSFGSDTRQGFADGGCQSSILFPSRS